MGIKPLCIEPHPVLRLRARRVEAFTEDLQRVARHLIETMYANEGIGLAAPQIGCSLQLFVASPSRKRGRELIVANPVLDNAWGRATMLEGCLSLPAIWERVKRSASVRLLGQDVYGKPLVVEAGGLLAIVLQHECDHLEGRLFIDRLPWVRRLKRRSPLIHGAQRTADPADRHGATYAKSALSADISGT